MFCKVLWVFSPSLMAPYFILIPIISHWTRCSFVHRRRHKEWLSLVILLAAASSVLCGDQCQDLCSTCPCGSHPLWPHPSILQSSCPQWDNRQLQGVQGLLSELKIWKDIPYFMATPLTFLPRILQQYTFESCIFGSHLLFLIYQCTIIGLPLFQ